MECLKCGHKSEAITIRCTACGASFPRAAFDQLTRIRAVLEEADRWARDGLITEQTLRLVTERYRSQKEHLEEELGLRLPVPTVESSPEIPPETAPREQGVGEALRRPPTPVPAMEETAAPSPPLVPARRPAGEGPVPAPPITWEGIWKALLSERALDLMLYLGAFLFVVSTAVLVLRYWTTFHPVTRAFIGLSVTGLFYVGGAVARSRMRARHSGTVIVGIGSLLVPLNTVTIAQIFGVERFGWPSLWLFSSLVMLPLNAATAGWLRAEFFGYVALASAVTAVVSAAGLLGLPVSWWAVPVILCGAALALWSPRITAPFLTILRRPFYIGGVLLGLLSVPWVWWIGGEVRAYASMGILVLHKAPPVAAAWWAAAAMGVILSAQARTRLPAYGTVAAVCGAAILTTAALAPVRWISLGLVVLAAASALGETTLARATEAVAIPCRRGAWACAAVGGAWSLVSLGTAFSVLALDAAVVLWWSCTYRRSWLIFLGLALVAGALTAGLLLLPVDHATIGIWWIGLALVYLGAARLLPRSPGSSSVLYLAAYGLLVCAQVPTLLWPSPGLQIVALGVVLVVSAWSIRLGDHDAGLQALLNALPPRWQKTFFASAAAALFPLWAVLVWKWRGYADTGAGIVLSVIALLYAQAGYRLSRAASPRARPLLSLTYVLSALGPALALADRRALSVTFLLDTLLLAGLARGFRSQLLADLAVGTSMATILAAPLRPPAWFTPPLLAAVALLYRVASGQAGRIPEIALFRRSLIWVSRIVAAVAFGIASVDFIDGRTVPGLAGYGALALLLIVWSLMEETPWPGVLGAVIGAGGLTIAVHSGLLLPLGLPSTDYGPAWAALALVLGAIGVSLGRWRRGAAGLLPLAGTALAIVALLEAVGRPQWEWWTLLFALALFGSCAIFQLRGRLPLVDGYVESITRSPALQSTLRAGYGYLLAALLPFWVWLTLDRIPAHPLTREDRGVGLVLLAFVYLGMCRFMRKRDATREMPWLAAASPLAASGLLVAATDRLPFVIADGAATVLCVSFALTLRTARWLYPAAVLAAPAWVLGLAHAGLSTRLLGPGLLVLAVGDLALGEWLTRRAGGGVDSIPAVALPFWITGFVLIPPALLWGSVSGATIALAMFLTGAAVYWVTGLRFDDALFSYPVTGLLGLSYIAAVPLVQDRPALPHLSWAVWFLPGVVASMLAAGTLSRTHTPLRARPFFSRSPAAAPVVLASGGAAAVVLLGGSEPWLRVWVTAAAGTIYILGLRVARSPSWLYPALLAGHLAYGFALWDAGLAPNNPLAIWFVPVMLAMTAVGVAMSGGRDRGEGRTLADRFRSATWGGPFYMFAAVGLLVWMIAALSNTQALAVVLTAGTVMVGAIAAWWRDARFGSLSAILGAAAVLAVFAWGQVAAPTAEPWIAVIALAFGILWGAAVIVARPRTHPPAVAEAARFWAGPLRLEAIILGAVALAGSIVGVLAGLPGSDRAFILCLALVGFLALEIATLEEREVLSYVAVLMLGVAWGLWFYYDRGVREVQFYAVPGALYLLWVGLTQDRRRRPRLAGILDGAGLTLLLGSSFLQSVIKAQSPLTLAYGGLVAIESLGIVWWGVARRLRRFAVAGSGALVLDVLAQSIQPLLLMSRWVITGVVGLVLILGALVVERKRETIVRISQQVRAGMEEWRW